MRLIHLTDPHLSSLDDLPLWRLAGKRWLGYLSWRRKRRFVHLGEMLETLIEAVHQERPDQIAITGDLIHIGMPREIAVASQWLSRVGSPQQVILTPGNHDLYAAESWPLARQQWGPYLQLVNDDADALPEDCYPVQRSIGKVQLIGLCSACPTPPLMASGRLGAGQLQRLAWQIQSAREQGKFCCLLIHHPPLPGQMNWRKGLSDAAALQQLVQAQPVDLILHGHGHRNSYASLDQIPVYGTASASSISAGAPACYRRFDIHQDADRWRVEMSLIAPAPPGRGDGQRVLQQDSWISGRLET